MRFDHVLAFQRLRKTEATVETCRVPSPAQRGIIATDATGGVVEFIEMPETPKSHIAFSGVLIGGPALFDLAPTGTPADIGFEVLPKLVGKIFAFPIADYVLDIGTMVKYEQGQREWPGLGSR